jgi:hypothetical protein
MEKIRELIQARKEEAQQQHIEFIKKSDKSTVHEHVSCSITNAQYEGYLDALYFVLNLVIGEDK